MIRNTFLATVGMLVLAASSQAGVVINQVKSTSAMAGHSLWTLTAVSDDPNQPILGFDFSGDPDNNDPATGLGFFGAMNQVNPVSSPTIYQDSNNFFPLVSRNVNEDSQFLFMTSAVVPSAPASQEGANILQATFAFADPAGLSVPFAQLVIPDAVAGTVSYRGDVLVGQSGAGVNARVSGLAGQVVGGIAPTIADVSGQTNALGDVINLTPIDTTGDPDPTWSVLGGPTYTPGFGALPGAPGLGAATWSWNPATQAFQFNTLGSTRGTYVWTGSATNATGTDAFSVTVDVRHVPEPATMALVGLAVVGFVGFARKRS